MKVAKRVVRANTTEPSPFLDDNLDLIIRRVNANRDWGLGGGGNIGVIDVGAGNCRNLHYVRRALTGFRSVRGYDLEPADAYVDKLDLVYQKLPDADASVDLVLCQYVLMFLPDYARLALLEEIDRVSKDGALLVMELHNVKQSMIQTKAQLNELSADSKAFFLNRGWVQIGPKMKHHFILQKHES